MRIKYPFTKLYLISFFVIIIGWILNALMWTGYFPFKFFKHTFFIGLFMMYIGFGLFVISLIIGFYKSIRNV